MNRTLRNLSLSLALAALAGPAFAADEVTKDDPAAKEGYGLPTISMDMLVFEDETHFDAVFSELMAAQALEDEAGGREGDDREAAAFQDFALSLGFESLLMSIEAETARLDEKGGVSEFNDPDEHQIFDPYFRGVLNPQAEIMVGDTIYRYHPHGYYMIDAKNLKALDEIRQGHSLEDRGGDDGVDFVGFGARMGCCDGDYSDTQFFEYDGGDRRMKAKQWVKNWGIYASIGGRTKNQKKGFLGAWWGNKADTIGVRGSVMKTGEFCTFEHHIDFQKVRSNDKKVTKLADWTLNAPQVPLWAKDYFDTTHWVEDGGDARMETLSMCECREATASFTLPTSSTDSSNIPFNGTASQNEANHFIEIYRTNAWGSNTVSGNYWSSWFSGQAGIRNLADLYNFTDLGGGTIYRVKLAVQNGCTNWDEQVRWIRVRDEMMHVQYRAHVKSHGWLGWVLDGATAGTTGQSRRMEAAQIKLINPDPGMQICYRAHVKGNGWLSNVCDGATAGTTGQSRRMEAIRISLVNAPAGCNVEYRAHVKGHGWLGWVSNGATAGTTGESRRMEALQVKLVGCP